MQYITQGFFFFLHVTQKHFSHSAEEPWVDAILVFSAFLLTDSDSGSALSIEESLCCTIG